jgi:hypothetical protein
MKWHELCSCSWQENGIAAKISATWRFIRKVGFSYRSAKNKRTNCRWRGYNYMLLIINMISGTAKIRTVLCAAYILPVSCLATLKMESPLSSETSVDIRLENDH